MFFFLFLEHFRSAQIVKVSVLLNCLLSYSLQIYVCVECVWNTIKHRFGKRELMANYIFRFVIILNRFSKSIKIIFNFSFFSDFLQIIHCNMCRYVGRVNAIIGSINEVDRSIWIFNVRSYISGKL